MDDKWYFILGTTIGVIVTHYVMKNKVCPVCGVCNCPICGTITTVSLIEGQREGSLLVQNIYEDHIDGLNFIEYPLANVSGTPVTLFIGQSVSNGCTETLTLTQIVGSVVSISGYQAIFSKVVDNTKICPV